MTAPFSDYTDMNHRAKQVGGPKTYKALLVSVGLLGGVLAREYIPRFAAWATPKIESMRNGAKARFAKPVSAPKRMCRRGNEIKIVALRDDDYDQAKGGVENEIQDSDALS